MTRVSIILATLHSHLCWQGCITGNSQVTFQSSNCDVHRPIGYANAYEGGVNYRPLFLIDVGHDVKVYRSLISKNLYHLRNKKVH